MLDFNTYRNLLDELEDEIKALDKEIQYACTNQQNTISSEEQKILDNDLDLQRMNERKKRLADRRAFIYKTAEMPEEDMVETDVYK